MSSFITTLGGKRCTAIPRSTGTGTTTGSGNRNGNGNANQNGNDNQNGQNGQNGNGAAASTAASTTAAQVTTTSAAAVAPPASTTTPPPAAVAPAVDSTTVVSSSTPTPEPAVITPPPPPAPETTAAAATTSPAAAPTTSESSTESTAPGPSLAAPVPAVPTIPTPADPTSSTSTTSSSSSSTSSSRATVVAQSEVRASDTSTESPIQTTTLSSAIPSPTTESEASPASSSSSATISPTPKLSAAPVVGGIMGGVALVGILFFLWWQYKKRRARDSLLTPLTLTPQPGQEPMEKYEIDNESLGPTARREIWKAHAGGVVGRMKAIFGDTSTSLRAKFDRDTPSVNLNRGNSQFIQAIPQHSRTNSSVMSTGQGGQLTSREKLSDWWTRFTEDVNFNWRLRNLVGNNKDPLDPYTAARSMNEKASRNRQTEPDFSNFLAMKDSELREAADRRRNSITASQRGLGSLGLDFSAPMDDDPFADPVSTNGKPTIPNVGETLTLNPFADPASSTVPAPKPTAGPSPPANYVADIRRSRGQSISTSNAAPASRLPSALPHSRYPSTVPGSRYPSTIQTSNSHDSFRSSTFSMNPRKKAGRSDPFDLETLQLGRPNYENYPTQNVYAGRNSGLSRITQSPTSSVGGAVGSERAPSAADGKAPRVVSQQDGRSRIVSETGTYSSKYSSGASQLMSEWGDPGPDLGPGSGSLRGAEGMPRRDSDSWDLERKVSNTSGKSVGKAM